MLVPTVFVSFLITVALSHSTQNAEEPAFSEERLQELERKWGTDVSRMIPLLYIKC